MTPAEEAELIAFVRGECARGRAGDLKKPTYLRAKGERSRGNARESLMSFSAARLVLRMYRGDAAAATRIFRGDESRRRRGCDMDIPWR